MTKVVMYRGPECSPAVREEAGKRKAHRCMRLGVLVIPSISNDNMLCW